MSILVWQLKCQDRQCSMHKWWHIKSKYSYPREDTNTKSAKLSPTSNSQMLCFFAFIFSKCPQESKQKCQIFACFSLSEVRICRFSLFFCRWIIENVFLVLRYHLGLWELAMGMVFCFNFLFLCYYFIIRKTLTLNSDGNWVARKHECTFIVHRTDKQTLALWSYILGYCISCMQEYRCVCERVK